MSETPSTEGDALATAECNVCGLSVTRIEGPLHIEDHVQRGDLFRVGIDWGYDPTTDVTPPGERRA
jgi:hypothetical protein